jgi:putative membrane protein
MIGAATLLADSGFGDHMDNWGAGWWILMMVMMVVFWTLVIIGVVWLVRSVGSGQHRHHPGASAIEVLDARLAHGEISPDEYRERRAVLEGERRTAGSG